MDTNQTICEVQKSLKYIVGLRFVRAFIYGGLSAAVVVMESGANILQPKTYLTALAIAFATGGLLALDKWAREAIKRYLGNQKEDEI